MKPIDPDGSGEQRLFQISAERHVPVNGSIEVSPLCNFDCDMCYVRLSREEMEARGRLHTAEEWLRIAGEMKEAGVLFLLLTGGEPLLYPGFRELYLGLRKMGFILTINTNGSMLDEAWADFFRENPPRRINITLYGIDENAYQSLCHFPGGFARTMKAIRLLKERELPLKLNYSLTRVNAPELQAFLELSRELELFCTIDPYMIPATRERLRPYDFSARIPRDGGVLFPRDPPQPVCRSRQLSGLVRAEHRPGGRGRGALRRTPRGKVQQARGLPCGALLLRAQLAGTAAPLRNAHRPRGRCVFRRLPRGLEADHRGHGQAAAQRGLQRVSCPHAL